jgi:hypothetical protein
MTKTLKKEDVIFDNDEYVILKRGYGELGGYFMSSDILRIGLESIPDEIEEIKSHLAKDSDKKRIFSEMKERLSNAIELVERELV